MAVFEKAGCQLKACWHDNITQQRRIKYPFFKNQPVYNVLKSIYKRVTTMPNLQLKPKTKNSKRFKTFTGLMFGPTPSPFKHLKVNTFKKNDEHSYWFLLSQNCSLNVTNYGLPDAKYYKRVWNKKKEEILIFDMQKNEIDFLNTQIETNNKLHSAEQESKLRI
jgi:hypothetical protein